MGMSNSNLRRFYHGGPGLSAFRCVRVAVRKPGTREGLGPYQCDYVGCYPLFFPCRTAVRSRRCGDILFGFVCPHTVAICLLHRRAAGSGEQERSLDRIPAASASLGSSLRHCLARTFVLDANPWMQLFLCGPVALLAGGAYIALSSPSRRVAVNVFSIVRDLKNAPTLASA